jgi:hypothetical protein
MTHIIQNHPHSPLIGIIVEEKGEEVVRYFTDEKSQSHKAQPKTL